VASVVVLWRRLWRRWLPWRLPAAVAWHSMMAVSAVNLDSANFVVVDSMIAISGAAASDSDPATLIMTSMTTTLTLIRMDMSMAIPRIGIDTAITRTPPAIGTTKTTAVARWFGDACTPRMAGTKDTHVLIGTPDQVFAE
jgi:hypothetical protein